MSTSRALRAGAVTLALVTTFSTSGCSAVSHLAQRATSSSTTTTPATTAPQRVLQSGLTDKLGANMTAHTSASAMVVASAGTSTPNAIVTASQKAATAVRALDPHSTKNPLLVIVPRDDAEFEKYTGEKVASQLANTVTSGNRLPYVVMAPWTVKNANSLMTQETLAHEAFHALTLEKLATERPLWLLEGWAEYVGQRTVPQAPHKREDISPHVPSDEELRGTDAADAYYAAFTFARYLRDTYGHDKVMAFYTKAVTTGDSLESLLREYFGHGLTQLENQYARWYPTFH